VTYLGIRRVFLTLEIYRTLTLHKLWIFTCTSEYRYSFVKLPAWTNLHINNIICKHIRKRTLVSGNKIWDIFYFDPKKIVPPKYNNQKITLKSNQIITKAKMQLRYWFGNKNPPFGNLKIDKYWFSLWEFPLFLKRGSEMIFPKKTKPVPVTSVFFHVILRCMYQKKYILLKWYKSPQFHHVISYIWRHQFNECLFSIGHGQMVTDHVTI